MSISYALQVFCNLDNFQESKNDNSIIYFEIIFLPANKIGYKIKNKNKLYRKIKFNV